MRPRLSVQWAASIASVFWGVWWTTFVKDIADSAVARPVILGYPVSHTHVLVALVLWGVIYAVVFVRWLYRVQYWGLETGLGRWFRESRSLIVLVLSMYYVVRVVPELFRVTSDLFIYGTAIVLLWPLAPLLVAVWPEDRR